MQVAKLNHKKEYNSDSQTIIKVPGVTTFLGEFSFYCQGKVACCANEHELYVSISENPDNQVRIYNSLTNDRKKFSVSAIKYRKEDKWANYVKGVYYILNERGFKLHGVDIYLAGSLLNDAIGVLSSAVSTGICLALNSQYKLGLSLDDITMVCYKACTSFCGEITRYSTIGTMIKAEKGKFLIYDLSNLTYQMIDNYYKDSKCSLLTVDCKIPPTAMREELIYRHSQIKEAFNTLRAKIPYASFKDFPISDLTDRIIPLDEETRKYCCAVLEESAAVSSLVRSFNNKDFIQWGKSLGRIGSNIRDVLELSCPEIDWLIKRSSEIAQCYGACPISNGDGACVVIVIENSAIDKYLAKLEDYERIFGFKADALILEPQGCWEQLI